MHVAHGMVAGYLRANPFHQQDLYSFGQERKTYTVQSTFS